MLKFVPVLTAILAVFAAVSASYAAPGSMVPDQLRCEGLENPLGVDTAQPRLSWVPRSVHPEARGLRQSAYRILVASTAERLAANRGDLWDSGKVVSDATDGIVYAGASLASSQLVHWKVALWDQSGAPSGVSERADWTMGVLTPEDWRASWITAPGMKAGVPGSLLLRREFEVKSGLRRAVVHVSGLGQYEMMVNGYRVGDRYLTPGWTDYRKTVLYDTFDVTLMLSRGANACGLILGNGMYHVEKRPGRYNKFVGSFGPPRAIAQIRLDYLNGTTEWVTTDGEWQTHPGPIVYSDVYGGEDYDARLEPKGWDRTGFAATGWTAAAVTEGPGGALRGLSVSGLPIRAVETMQPAFRSEIGPGVTVYDLGQNAPVMPRITVFGPAGATVRIVPSELVTDAGAIDDTVCGGQSYWTYTLAGKGREDWVPRFFYRGARYFQVECEPAEPGGARPVVEALAGLVVHADAPTAGRFNSSSDLLNRIYSLVRWAQRGNMMSVLTDCPHREKLGWLEETYLNGPALRYNFGLAPLFTKIVNDIADAQLDNGLVPNIAPEYTEFGWSGDIQFRETPEWGSAFIQIPWQQYLFTGDLELARRHYDGMKRYLAYLGTHVKDDGILRIPGSLGDWYDIGPNPPGRAQLTPVDLTATAIYYDDATILAAFAEQLGRPDEALAFLALAARIRISFDRAYLLADDAGYATASQTAQAMPYALGMVDPARRDKVLASLAQDAQWSGLTAGDVGYRYLLRALADGGRSDVVFDMTQQAERPGYAMQLAKGATSLTEAWDARRNASQNHFMLGQVNEWLFHDLAGIQPDLEQPGFKHILIKPALVDDLSWVRASYDSIRGRVTSEWRTGDGRIRLNLYIPPNTSATVYVPTPDPDSVYESARPASQSPGVEFLRAENGSNVYEVDSGRYTFVARYPETPGNSGGPAPPKDDSGTTGTPE